MPRSVAICRAQILSYLAAAPGVSSAAIQNATGISTADLFPVLRSLESDGLITGVWEDAPTPRPRLYGLTDAGRRQVGGMQPVEVRTSAASGNWFWRKFVAPFFGG